MMTVRVSRLLQAAVSQRMEDLGLDQQELAADAGVSAATVRDLQRGRVRRYRPATLAKVSTALGWSPDTMIRLLSAPEPDDRSPDDIQGEDVVRLDLLEAELATLRRRLADRGAKS